MGKYRKKPVVIEARRLTKESQRELIEWCKGKNYSEPKYCIAYGITIETLEGDMTAFQGDFIIKGVAGEFYPCKPDIFDQTYEAVDD